MGARDPNRRRVIPQWMSTLERMKEWNTRVRCMSKCGFWADVDIDPFIMILGWDGSLWDRRPPCEVGDCDALMSFHASPGASTPFWYLGSGVGSIDELPAHAWMGDWVGLADFGRGHLVTRARGIPTSR